MINFAESNINIKQRDDKRLWFTSGFVDNIRHFICVFKGTGKFRKKTCLDLVFKIHVF